MDAKLKLLNYNANIHFNRTCLEHTIHIIQDISHTKNVKNLNI